MFLGPSQKALPLAGHASHNLWAFGNESGGGTGSEASRQGIQAVPVKALLSQLETTSEKAPALNFLHNAPTPDSILAGSCNKIL